MGLHRRRVESGPTPRSSGPINRFGLMVPLKSSVVHTRRSSRWHGLIPGVISCSSVAASALSLAGCLRTLHASSQLLCRSSQALHLARSWRLLLHRGVKPTDRLAQA